MVIDREDKRRKEKKRERPTAVRERWEEESNECGGEGVYRQRERKTYSSERERWEEESNECGGEQGVYR